MKRNSKEKIKIAIIIVVVLIGIYLSYNILASYYLCVNYYICGPRPSTFSEFPIYKGEEVSNLNEALIEFRKLADNPPEFLKPRLSRVDLTESNIVYMNINLRRGNTVDAWVLNDDIAIDENGNIYTRDYYG